MKIKILTVQLLLAIPMLAASTLSLTYSNDTAPGFAFKDVTGALLTPGLELVSQDGAVLEVGYYTLATTENPFAGAWVTMVGPSIPASTFATIGDKTDGAAGLFNRSTGFGTTPLGPYAFPANGTQMSIRFFNAPASQVSTHYNAVSSVDWIWPGQGDPQTQFNMNVASASSLVWLDGTGSAFRTTIAVPEPAALILISCGAVIWSGRRRRI